MERRSTLSLTEWATLGLLAERPRHGYDISIELQPGEPIGEVWNAPRHAVYRALTRLGGLGHVEEHHTEAGDAAPKRTIYGVTRQGRVALDEWLDTPVLHLREVRSGLLLKLVLCERLGRKPDALISSQRDHFIPLLERRSELGDDEGPVSRWRFHAARAVANFLDDLED